MDEIQVLVSDLEYLQGALNAAHKQNESWDIFDGYRKLGSRFNWSAQTRQLQEALTKVEAYIEAARDDDNADG